MKQKAGLKLTAVFMLAALAALALSSCAAGDHVTLLSEALEGETYMRNAVDADSAPEAYSSRGGEPGSVPANSDVRHVIRVGYLDLTVKDTRETLKTVREIVQATGGIISNSRIYEMREGQYAADLTLRVPVTRFDQILEQLQDLGKAGDINTSEQDVTMQYLELDQRIKNYEVQEERLREILEMADTVEDVLAVERELGRVRGEIEVMTTQFNHLQDQVSYSTINLYIREEYIATQTISPAPFENLGTRMKEALLRSVNFIMAAFAGFLVVLTAMLPVLLILALIGYIVWRLIARAAKRKTPPA